jgi:hypothetical protein
MDVSPDTRSEDMDDLEFLMGVEEDTGPEIDISVSVKCPFCPRGFDGPRDRVEEELFMHLWKVHEVTTLDYMLNNMYIPPELKERIFGEMGPEYVAWIVDTEGEITEET